LGNCLVFLFRAFGLLVPKNFILGNCLAFLFRAFHLLVPKNFILGYCLVFQYFSHDEGYSRNLSWTLS
jgi:hypothetical protein